MEKEYRTGNIKKVAFLSARNIPLYCRPNPRRPGKAEFTTPITSELMKALEDFECNELVPVQDLFDRLEEATDQVMTIKRGGGVR